MLAYAIAFAPPTTLLVCGQITELDSRSSGDAKRTTSSADRVFQKALKQFRMTLLTTYGLSQRGDGALALGIKYRDLIDSFASVSGRGAVGKWGRDRRHGHLFCPV